MTKREERTPMTNEELMYKNVFRGFDEEELAECWKDYLFFSANGYLKKDAYSYTILRHFCINNVLGMAEYAIQLMTAISCKHFKQKEEN